MKLIKQSHQILTYVSEGDMLAQIESAGRTCYKSEDKMTDSSAKAFVEKIIKNGHHSVLEHINITVRFITDRGVTHELVRHRLAAYSQESTRYCNYYGKDMEFIIPVWLYDESKRNEDQFFIWKNTMAQAEKDYNQLIASGWTPQQARTILPHSLKTEIVMTANVREWKHVFKLRTSEAAHPQMMDLMKNTQDEFIMRWPILFQLRED